jgi:hypothetical protein
MAKKRILAFFRGFFYVLQGLSAGMFLLLVVLAAYNEYFKEMSGLALLFGAIAAIPVFVLTGISWLVRSFKEGRNKGLGITIGIAHVLLANPLFSIPVARTFSPPFIPLVRNWSEQQNQRRSAEFESSKVCVEREIRSYLAIPRKITRVVDSFFILENGWMIEAQGPTWVRYVPREAFIDSLKKFENRTILFRPSTSYAFGGLSSYFQRIPSDQVPKICGQVAGSEIPVELQVPSEWGASFDQVAKSSISPSPHELDCSGLDRILCEAAAANHAELKYDGCFIPGLGGGSQTLSLEKCWSDAERHIRDNCGSDIPPFPEQRVAVVVMLRHENKTWAVSRSGIVETVCDKRGTPPATIKSPENWKGTWIDPKNPDFMFHFYVIEGQIHAQYIEHAQGYKQNSSHYALAKSSSGGEYIFHFENGLTFVLKPKSKQLIYRREAGISMGTGSGTLHWAF